MTTPDSPRRGPAPDAPTEVPPGARRALGWMVAMLLITVVLFFVSVPWSFGVVLTAPAALVAGVVALMSLRGQPAPRGLSRSIAFGMVIATLASVTGAGMLVLRGPSLELKACMDRALTNSAQHTCEMKYNQSVERMLENWGVTAP